MATFQGWKALRFTVTKLRSELQSGESLADRVPTTVQIAELQFRRDGQIVRLTGCTASNPGGSNPEQQIAANAIDGNESTKWLDLNNSPLILFCQTPVLFQEFTFITANDVRV